VYNSAGEKVDIIYQGSAASVPASVTLSTNLVLAGTTAVQVNLGTAMAGGGTTAAWTGVNGNGQSVASGVYYIRVEYVDNFGQATTYVVPVQVLAPSGASQAVSIFNSAGELVWQGSLPAASGPSGQLSISDAVLVQDLNPANGGLVKPLAIRVGAGTLYWNGENLSGLAVSPGTYTVQVSEVQAGASTSVQTKQFTVMASALGLPSADAIFVPNPWRGDQPLAAYYTPYPGDHACGTIFTLAGEKVMEAVDLSNGGRLQFPSKKLAAGVYLLDFRQMQGASVAARRVSKLAIVE
jgi:flagellar hook assembly protein FlgD